MKQIILLLTPALLAAGTLMAQKPLKSKAVFFENVVEDDNYKIHLVDVVATKEYTKMKVRIQNKTKDFLVFKPAETFMTLPAGELAAAGKLLQIKPFDIENRVVEVTSNGLVYDFKYLIRGLYRVPAGGNVLSAPDFLLPAATNSFTAGPFEVMYFPQHSSKETQLTDVSFQVTYKGTKIGISDHTKAICRLDNGQEFSIVNAGDKSELLYPGESKKFRLKWTIPANIADMQFANMTIIWRESFRETEEKKMPEIPFDLKYDSAGSK